VYSPHRSLALALSASLRHLSPFSIAVAACVRDEVRSVNSNFLGNRFKNPDNLKITLNPPFILRASTAALRCRCACTLRCPSGIRLCGVRRSRGEGGEMRHCLVYLQNRRDIGRLQNTTPFTPTHTNAIHQFIPVFGCHPCYPCRRRRRAPARRTAAPPRSDYRRRRRRRNSRIHRPCPA
jgi:hypothetical protein